MAFTAKPSIVVDYVFRDNDGKQSTTQVPVPAAVAPADALLFANALRPLMAALSDGVIVGQNVIIGSYEDAVPVIARSDVEDKGVFLWNTANGQPASISVPSVAEAILQSNNEDIDLTNASVIAFVDAMTLGLGTPLVQPANASGGDVVSVKEAFKRNTRSLKSGGVRRKG